MPRTESENKCAFALRSWQWAWLGVSDLEKEGVYEGADGCGAFPAKGGHWRRGDPDNHRRREDCVAMINYDQWNDRPCDDNSFPLCQLKDCLKPECLQ